MADKGIIFSAAMVRALLDGRKTQTRRLVSPSAKQKKFGCKPGMAFCANARLTDKWIAFEHPRGGPYTCIRAPYASSDRLYVREAAWIAPPMWTDSPVNPMGPQRQEVAYKADDRSGYTANAAADYKLRLRPSIHMPRWASRMWLVVTDVRVQRLQECSEVDAWAEGLIPHPTLAAGAYVTIGDMNLVSSTALGCYSMLWNSLHTAEGERWEDNPWVVTITFEVHQGNIDAGERDVLRPAPRGEG